MIFDDVDNLTKEFTTEDMERDNGLLEPKDIRAVRNVAYGPYNRENFLDIYYPEGMTVPFPTIISVHGGAYFYGSKEIYRFYCMELARLGFAVVNYNYRLAPNSVYPASLEDLNQLCDWLTVNGSSYELDLNQLYIVGDSAGAQIASQYLAFLTNSSYTAHFDFEPASIQFKAAGLNCGVYLMGMDQPINHDFPAYFDADKMDAICEQFPVEKYITNKFPPSFVMTACDDFLRETSKSFAEILEQRGVSLMFKEYIPPQGEYLGHVFHLDVRNETGKRCNREQAEFFKRLQNSQLSN